MRALVEQLHEEEGVHGWVFDPADPQRTLVVELWAGTSCVATTQTGLDRPDVSISTGIPCRPGFRFGGEATLALKDAATRGAKGDLYVRVRGSDRLETHCPPRTLDMVRLTCVTADGGDQLLAMLKHHASQAELYANEADASKVVSRIGYLEAIWTSKSGMAWLVGWMIDDAVADRPMIVQDTVRHAAGIAFSVAPRTDLEPGAKAFVAVMQSDWQPDIDFPPHLELADGSGRYIEPVRTGLLTNSDDVLPLVRDTLYRASGPHRTEMLALLKANRHARASGNASDRVQVDEVAILPGFGVFVIGWALSVSRHAAQFFLEADDHTITSDDPSGLRFMRTDLASLMPNVEQALHTAGFVALFRGPVDHVTLDRLSLRVDWNDGASTLSDIAPAAVRVLGLTSPLASICRFYPAIESERFFSDFAYHAALFAQAQARHLQCYECNPVNATLLLAAPLRSEDLFLLFDQAARHAALLPEGWGISIVAPMSDHRGLLLTLFAQLQRSTTRPCSLFFTSGNEPTSDVIEEVAAALSSERIAWVDSRVSLTAAGWTSLANDRESLVLLAVDDPLEGSPPSIGLDAFIADLTRWRWLCAAAPPRIGGIQLPPQSGPVPVVDSAAVALAPSAQSRFTLKLNEAIDRAHG